MFIVVYGKVKPESECVLAYINKLTEKLGKLSLSDVDSWGDIKTETSRNQDKKFNSGRSTVGMIQQ